MDGVGGGGRGSIREGGALGGSGAWVEKGWDGDVDEDAQVLAVVGDEG